MRSPLVLVLVTFSLLLLLLLVIVIRYRNRYCTIEGSEFGRTSLRPIKWQMKFNVKKCTVIIIIIIYLIRRSWKTD